MKILYININNETIKESDEIKVIKPDTGSLFNDFLYSLGEIITEGVPNASGIKLVKLFTNADGYDDFVSQWKAIEPLLFAEEPVSGKRDISIPDKYLHWLRHQNVEVLQDIYEAIKDREAITIDLENFYDDSIGELQAKIARYLKKDTSIEAVQFSSPLVKRKSQIVRYLKRRYEDVVFKENKVGILDSYNPNTPQEPCHTYKSIFVGVHTDSKFFGENPKNVTLALLNVNGEKISEDVFLPVTELTEEKQQYVLAFNVSDNQLYCITSKEVKALYDWTDGSLAYEYTSNKSTATCFENKFRIELPYDIEKRFSVEHGMCKEDANLFLFDEDEPYYDNDEEMPYSRETDEAIKIPGYKFAVYLGIYNGVAIFWATTDNVTADEIDEFTEFRNADIVNINSKIISHYLHTGFPMLSDDRRYMITRDITREGAKIGVSTIDGKELFPCVYNVPIDAIVDDDYEMSNIIAIDCGGVKNYFLLNDKIFCSGYSENYYVMESEDENVQELYNRHTKKKICDIVYDDWDFCPHKEMDCMRMDDISGYYREMADGLILTQLYQSKHYVIMDKNGQIIYTFKFNRSYRYEVMPEVQDYEGRSNYILTAGENRIIIACKNEHNGYFKIIDYKGNEIKRTDEVKIHSGYQNGKCVFLSGDKLGYLDINGNTQYFEWAKDIHVSDFTICSDNVLLLITQTGSLVVTIDGRSLVDYGGALEYKRLGEGLFLIQELYSHENNLYEKRTYLFDRLGNSIIKDTNYARILEITSD